MTKYYREKIKELEQAVEAIKSQQQTYKVNRENPYSNLIQVDISPRELFQRIELLAQATGFEIVRIPSCPSYYKAEKIRRRPNE